MKKKDSIRLESLWRIFIISLIALGLVTFVGCGGGGGDVTVPDYDSDATKENEEIYLHEYELNETGTIVTELDTGVMWVQAGGWQTMVWEDAMQYCEDLVLEGYDTWELPEKGLLAELFERDALAWHSDDQAPFINDIFDCRADEYWSSTENVMFEEWAYTVDYSDNPNDVDMIVDNVEKAEYHYVRCVLLPDG